MLDASWFRYKWELLELHVCPLEGMKDCIDLNKLIRFLENGNDRHGDNFVEYVFAVVGEVEGRDEFEESCVEDQHILGKLTLFQLFQVDCCEILELFPCFTSVCV